MYSEYVFNRSMIMYYEKKLIISKELGKYEEKIKELIYES